MPDDDDFTAEELAEFAAVPDDELIKIERFAKWRSKKASAGAPSGAPKLSSSGPTGEPVKASFSNLGLKDLSELINDEAASSILEHMLEKKRLLASAAAKPGSKPSETPAKRFTRLLK